ncbi:hypothetical protein AsAng_0042110 [Aureispira anguillae]|uniref:Uncharacterized protein n=1 Tax=Aureispira anguillae TaxID=2864201 RepID=A0A915YIG1_9BACT|nr:hypothetical protein AsAng_0042110 [Aureispira anguillae]
MWNKIFGGPSEVKYKNILFFAEMILFCVLFFKLIGWLIVVCGAKR